MHPLSRIRMLCRRTVLPRSTWNPPSWMRFAQAHTVNFSTRSSSSLAKKLLGFLMNALQLGLLARRHRGPSPHCLFLKSPPHVGKGCSVVCLKYMLAKDAANNFARGHYTIGKEIVDLVLDRIRKFLGVTAITLSFQHLGSGYLLLLLFTCDS